ncbi:MAG TPA: YegS/Rv2252/BmrU family lipid kinase [Terriglobales bacterium]|nr:YegS/Rv2252/BmrU family lipid kinase [Terriglobales bacterium]
MRKVLLLYNPLSGRRRGRRLADVQAAAAVLRSSGVAVSTSATQVAGDATGQVKQAIAEGCDAIFACGGDGTVSDVLQGLIGSDVALGVIPLGTANSLAHDIGLPLSPAGAAHAALTAKPQRIAVGRIEYLDFEGKPQARHFIVAVGIGVDAHLFYKLNPVLKRHLGMMAYYVKATRLWLTHRMENFDIEVSDGLPPRQAEVSQILAVRIQDFGGILRELAPGASLERDDLRVVLFHTRSRAAYLGYIIRGLLGKRWKIPGIELIDSCGVSCRPSADSQASKIFVEADGELLGGLPAQISVVPNAVSLLIPGA